jgi:hypothetical protein
VFGVSLILQEFVAIRDREIGARDFSSGGLIHQSLESLCPSASGIYQFDITK